MRRFELVFSTTNLGAQSFVEISLRIELSILACSVKSERTVTKKQGILMHSHGKTPQPIATPMVAAVGFVTN